MADKKIRCPRCSSLLKKKFMRKIKHPSGAILDVCNDCGGMWLDKDEVMMLYHFSAKQSLATQKKKTKRR